MWPTTAAFAAALLEPSRTWATKVDVFYDDQFVTALDVLVDGSVTVDDVAVRRSVDLKLVDPWGNLTPASARDLLAPKGTEIRPYRGLLVNGAYEWVPLGVFGVVEPEVSAHASGTVITLKGWDRVDAVRVRRFEEAWPVASGTPTHEAISDIVTSRLDVPTRITQTASTTPEVVFDALSDPWDAVRKLAEADSLAAYFDPQGTLVVEPALESATGIEYSPGTSSLLLETTRKISADTTYSGVISTGEHPETGAIRYVLWDTDTSSPTYYLGPFGKRPYGFTSSLMDTTAKVQAAAETLLPKVTGMKQEVTIRVAGHPGHDIGDLVVVNDPKSKTSGTWAVKSATIPLRLGGVRLRLVEASS